MVKIRIPPFTRKPVETFFTSDTHFGHANVIKYSERPFLNVEEMNEGLIERWNERVSKGDHVYHLGDFSLTSKKEPHDVFFRLNGRIHLVRGNHDKVIKGWLQDQFEWVKDYHEMKGPGDVKIVLCHYGFMVWNKSHYGSWHLHGHSHGNLQNPNEVRRLDVGVDTHDYYPYSMDEVEEIMDGLGIFPVDHHRPRR